MQVAIGLDIRYSRRAKIASELLRQFENAGLSPFVAEGYAIGFVAEIDESRIGDLGQRVKALNDTWAPGRDPVFYLGRVVN